MKMKSLLHLTDNLPDIFEYVTDKIGNEGKELVEESNSLSGLLMKILSKPVLMKCHEISNNNKLKDYGYLTYLEAASSQGESSLNKLSLATDLNFINDEVLNVTKKVIKNEILDMNETIDILRFDYTKHPAVKRVKKIYIKLLEEFAEPEDQINEFIKDFNDNIESRIKLSFGDSFFEHCEMIKDYWLKENELELLDDAIKLGKIGFNDNENLTYETTYAKWEEIREYNSDKFSDEDEYEDIHSLIDEYFGDDEESLEKILFIVADFGKGKSVFMRHYAMELALEYLSKAEGKIPIYFNLREFSDYSHESKLGVIEDYLLTKYKIDINDSYYKNKEYIFLLDGLDECGELTANAIDKVMDNISRIQHLDKSLCRKNQIIVSTRPISDYLLRHLSLYNPKEKCYDNCIPIPCYISVLGFKKEQVNKYIFNNLEKFIINDMEYCNFSKLLIDNLKDKNIDIANKLLNDKVISKSELRRPIFTYMILQLIINNVDFYKYGKIGIYLSFINLLTRDAKHINDKSYKIKLVEEYEYRNILHGIASLWMIKRSVDSQSILNKADICRAIKRDVIEKSDNEVLEQYKQIKDIHFLSHSYFGENSNSLHFHHQSFAEILLAEYYLKSILKYSLDDEDNILDLSVALSIGEPTEQTLIFFTDLITLLRECSVSELSEDVLNKRKLIAPLLASLGTVVNNNMYSQYMKIKWNDEYISNPFQNTISQEALVNWPVKEKEIILVIDKMKKLFNYRNTNFFMKGKQLSSLYNDEVYSVKNYSKSANSRIDKWMALAVGNGLKNSIDKYIFFNRDLSSKMMISLLKELNYIYDGIPKMWKNLFVGCIFSLDGDLKNNFDYNLKLNENFNYDSDWNYLKNKYITFYGLSLIDINFSYCVFDDVEFNHCNLYRANFSNSYINSIRIISSSCKQLNLDDVKLNNIDLFNSFMAQDILFPYKMVDSINRHKENDREGYVHYRGSKVSLNSEGLESFCIQPSEYSTLFAFIKYIRKHRELQSTEILSWFDFNKKSKWGKRFIELIYSI